MNKNVKSMEEIVRDIHEMSKRNYFTIYNHVQLTVIERDYVEVEATIDENMLNRHGTVHGGMYFTMADFCGACCARTDGREYVTLHADIHYLRAAESGRLIAKSRIIRRGGTTVLAEANVYDEKDRLLTTSTVSMFCISE